MLSRVDFTGDKEALRYIDAIRKKLINPEVEAKATADFIEKTVIPRRFEEQKGPTGNPWKPSKRVLKSGGKTLTLSGKLRHGLKPKISINSTGVDISFVPSTETAKYAYLHNNGGRVKNRSGRFTTMPKRQYAYTTAEEKRIIIKDIWVRGLMSA